MGLPRRIVTGFCALFQKPRIERELDEELRTYQDMAAEEKIRGGMARTEALRAARVEMGSTAALKDTIRDAGWESLVESFWQDIRYAIRTLRKNLGFTAVVVLTLALGIGANTAIFSLIDAVMLRSLPVRNPEELVQLQIRDSRAGNEPGTTFTNPLWEQIRDRQDVFAGVFAWSHDRFNLANGGAVQYAEGAFVSGSYFSTLGVQPAAGRLLSPADDQRGCPAVAVLSYGFWQDRFGGSPSVIGSTLPINRRPFQVIGVSAPGFFGVDVGQRSDITLPICAAALFDGKESRLDHHTWWWLNVMARVQPGNVPSALQARLDVLSPQVFRAALPPSRTPRNQQDFISQRLVSASAASGSSDMRRVYREPLTILMGVVGLVLLIACANIAGLMFARAVNRSKEMAVRRALGASRARLIRQLLTECALLSGAGAILGLVVAGASSSLLIRHLSTARNLVFLDLSLNGRVLGFTAALALLTGILFGIVPAWRSTRVSLTAAMKGSQTADGAYGSRFRAGRWVVASQLAFSLVLLVVAGLLLRSFVRLATFDLGFERSGVLLVSANLESAQIPAAQRSATYDAIQTRLQTLPGVVSVSRSLLTPSSGINLTYRLDADSPNAPREEQSVAFVNYVSPGYFATMHTPLLAGRDFDEHDAAASPRVAVVNQTLARRFFSGMNPIGRTFRDSPAPAPYAEIVGVVKDTRDTSPREEAEPRVFFPIAQLTMPHAAEDFELRTATRPMALSSPVQQAVSAINQQVPLEFRTLAEQVEGTVVQEKLLAMLSAFFGALALLLASIGLYGVLSYLVSRRQAEFGIRMALGAPPRSIARLVLREVLAILLVGIATGFCMSLAAVTLLRNTLFGLAPRDAGTMTGAAVVLTAVALIACYLPARRAVGVNPMAALRNE